MTAVRMSLSIDKDVHKKLIEYHGKRLIKANVPLSLSSTVEYILEKELK